MRVHRDNRVGVHRSKERQVTIRVLQELRRDAVRNDRLGAKAVNTHDLVGVNLRSDRRIPGQDHLQLQLRVCPQATVQACGTIWCDRCQRFSPRSFVCLGPRRHLKWCRRLRIRTEAPSASDVEVQVDQSCEEQVQEYDPNH